MHFRRFRSFSSFPKCEKSIRGAALQNLLEKMIFWEIKYFIPIRIELARWFIESLQEHSKVPCAPFPPHGNYFQ